MEGSNSLPPLNTTTTSEGTTTIVTPTSANVVKRKSLTKDSNNNTTTATATTTTATSTTATTTITTSPPPRYEPPPQIPPSEITLDEKELPPPRKVRLSKPVSYRELQRFSQIYTNDASKTIKETTEPNVTSPFIEANMEMAMKETEEGPSVVDVGGPPKLKRSLSVLSTKHLKIKGQHPPALHLHLRSRFFGENYMNEFLTQPNWDDMQEGVEEERAAANAAAGGIDRNEPPLSATPQRWRSFWSRHSEESTPASQTGMPAWFHPWTWFSKCVTFYAPTSVLIKYGHMTDPRVQQAWREKMALCTIILSCCIIVAVCFFYLPNQLCPSTIDNIQYDQVITNTTGFPKFSSDMIMIRGQWFNSSQVQSPPGHFDQYPDMYDLFPKLQAADLTNYFRPTLSDDCNAFVLEGADTLFPPCKNVQVHPFLEHCHSLDDLSNGLITWVGRTWDDVSAKNSTTMVLNGMVVDMSHYLDNKVMFFGLDLHFLILEGLGTDASFLFYSKNQIPFARCLIQMYPVGMIDDKSMPCIVMSILYDFFMVIILGVVGVRFVLAFVFKWFMSEKLGRVAAERKVTMLKKHQKRFSNLVKKMKPVVKPIRPDSTALTPSWSNSSLSGLTSEDSTAFGDKTGDPLAPAGRELTTEEKEKRLRDWVMREMHVILFVTCYSEEEEGIRNTLNSLAETDYPSHLKLIFIIADGIVTGSGCDRSTPDIVLSMLEGADRDPAPVSYFAVADGARRHNMAKIYTGYYCKDIHRIPTVVVVKCGTPAEENSAKPGNRGKRDSQVLLMNFFNKVLFDSAMTPMEYVLFKKILVITGVTPDKFEIVLMVDADTKIASDALPRMIACMASDDLVIGLCGETRIANKRESWITAIQVFEYFISHHLAKAFESIFGGVTCLPGCFCMYRIKAPKDAGTSWVPILCNPNVILDYSQTIVETLHQKNLLLLGEDRFLSTLMLKNFPSRKMMFVPQAMCHTYVPADFEVLLSQRRRWINSTVHNLLELILVRELCGTFCFSMQFMAFMELLGTALLPISVIFALVLVFVAAQGETISPLPLVLMFVVTFLPAVLVLITTGKTVYIAWMGAYLIAIPVWQFFLPVYSFWHFDDFSWGQTRLLKNEKEGAGGHGESGPQETFDIHIIPMKKLAEYEHERMMRNASRKKSKGGMSGLSETPKSSQDRISNLKQDL